MKINKVMIMMLGMILLITMIGMASASLGEFKQNTCVPIRVLANCSSINLTEVDGVTINKVMTKQGQTFNYSYCSTSKIGTYAYSWNNPCVDCSSNDCGNSFEITPSGFKDTLGFYIILLVIGIGLIGLGFATKDYWFVFAGGISFMLIGLYSINYGIAGQRDMFITWGLGLFEIFMGGYLTIKAGLGASDIEM